MRLWFREYQLQDLIKQVQCNMLQHVGIEFIELGDDFIKARMPVDHRTQTPFGLLHGGASCVLAETLGSVASYLCIDPEKQVAVGIEINANHVKGIKQGFVVGHVIPIHIGKSTHVWDIRIYNEANQELLCVSRLTTKIM